MASAPASDPLLRFALASGEAVFLMTLALLFVIALLRVVIDARRQREQAVIARWQPAFFAAVEGDTMSLPRLPRRDAEIVLMNWLHFTESIRGEARQRLIKLAHAANLDDMARLFLKRRSVRLQLMGIVALGRMGSATDWEALEERMDDPGPMLSLLAARSLLMIDPARRLPSVLARLPQRDDWPRAKVAAMLAEAPQEAIAPTLLAALRSAAAEDRPRLLGLVDINRLGDAWSIIAPLLEDHQPVETLVAALKVCHDPRALEAVRRLADHAQWVVRAQAAITLGRLGMEEDIPLLKKLLADREWWVRYRAALALVGLPFVTAEEIVTMAGGLDDPFAAQIMRHVLAERSLGVST